jgi:hypothetical protein
MTDFGRSAKGPTLTDISSVASNASNITTVAGSMQDVQDVAAEINATPTLRSLMNSVLNDTISLSGLTDTTIGTLGNSEQGYALTWVWDVNTSTGDWQAQPGSSITVNGTVSVGNGLKWNASGYYENANFLEVGSSETISTSQISDIQTPTGPNQLAYTNNSSEVVFANTNIPGAYSFAGDITIGGNLNVTGTTTTINTQDLNVVDATITVANGSTSDATANGAGIEFGSHTGHPTFLYDGNNNQFGIDRTLVEKGDGSAAAGAVQYNCWNNNHYVILEGPVHNANGDNTVLRLPQSAPTAAGQVLSVKSTPNTANGVTTAELEFASSSGASTGFAIAMAIVF